GKHVELTALKKDGSDFPIELSLSKTKINNEWCSIGIIRDISERKEAAEKLKKSEERFRNFFENATVGLYRTSPDGKILDANAELVNMMGFSSLDQLVQLHNVDESYINSSDKKRFDEIINTEGVIHGFESTWKRVDGNPIHIQESARALYDDSGKIKSYEGAVVDITERKMIEEKTRKSEKQFRTVWENSFDGMRLTDERGVIIEVNNGYCRLVGLERNKLIGKTFDKAYKNKDQISLEKYINNFNSESFQSNFETEAKLLNGSKKWVSLSNTFIHVGDKKLLLSIFRDITDTKSYQKELIEAKEKAEEMNKVKSYFFANMSHELRTPFVGIQGYAELLSDIVTDSEEKELVDGLIDSSSRLRDTLNNILSLTKLEFEPPKKHITEVNVHELLNEVYNLFVHTAEQKNLSFTMNGINQPSFILSDEKLLRDIMNNLVSNAVKYTEEGKIEIYSSIKRNEIADYLKISVTDTGIGINIKDKEHIWDAFRQASEGMNRTFQGTGLGLTITKKYVESLGGTVSLESDFGIGSTFTFKIPVERVDATITGQLESAVKDEVSIDETKPKKLLLYVEDDKHALYFFKKVLSKKYNIEVTSDSVLAIEKVMTRKYDALFIDINLGYGMDGAQLMEKIREIPEYSDIPIVAVTAYASDADRKEFLSRGFSHYISKPFTKADLIELTATVLNEGDDNKCTRARQLKPAAI
ncbi:PAS domain S-box protein, partial [Bacteroidota bacterium]